MSVPNLKSFLGAITDLLGYEHLFESKELEPNVSGLERNVAARISVPSPGDVPKIVSRAREFKVPLYPVSRGLNWGYGSSLPVEDECVILDLSNLSEIRNRGEIGTDIPVAIIEPGVTQGALFEAVDSKGLFFNATGAGPETSILGNSLERGFGYYGLRPDDVVALEIVLGTGEVIRTGFWGTENASGALRYPSCLGPSLDGLFFQSNFGIVTGAAIRLREKPEAHAAMLVALDDEKDFPEFFGTLATLRRRRVFDSVMHVGNARRARSTLGPVMFDAMDEPGDPDEKRARVERHLDTLPYRAWSGVTAIQGTKAAVDQAFQQARAHLQGIASVERIDEESLAQLDGETSM